MLFLSCQRTPVNNQPSHYPLPPANILTPVPSPGPDRPSRLSTPPSHHPYPSPQTPYQHHPPLHSLHLTIPNPPYQSKSSTSSVKTPPCHPPTPNINTLKYIYQGPQPLFPNPCQNHPPNVMPQNPCSTASSTTHTMLPLQGSWKTGNMKTKIRAICTNITSICVARCASITSLDWTPAWGENDEVRGKKVVMVELMMVVGENISIISQWGHSPRARCLAHPMIPAPRVTSAQVYMHALFLSQVPHGRIY